MSADYIQAVPTINLTDDEHAAVTAAIRRAIEDDKFPHAPRLDPLRWESSRRPQTKSRSRRPRRQPNPISGAAITGASQLAPPVAPLVASDGGLMPGREWPGLDSRPGHPSPMLSSS